MGTLLVALSLSIGPIQSRIQRTCNVCCLPPSQKRRGSGYHYFNEIYQGTFNLADPAG